MKKSKLRKIIREEIQKLNESHESTKEGRANFICEVLSNNKLLKVFSEDNIKKIYDSIEDVLKNNDLYDEKKGIKK